MQPPPEELVHLNVGGVPFSTTTHTLQSPHAAGSFLALLTQPRALPTRRDAAGRLFIDRDGERFRAVLNFVRCGTVHVVDGAAACIGRVGGVPLAALLEEARFYGLTMLERVIDAELRRLDLEDSLSSMPPVCAPRAAPPDAVPYTPRRDASAAGASAVMRARPPVEHHFTLDADF